MLRLQASFWTTATSLSACFALALQPRATTIPAPLSFTPDQSWDGIDGSWNSYTIQVGSPAKYVRVFAATSSQQTWVVDVAACINATYFGADSASCQKSRGDIVNTTGSSTFDKIGWYSLWIEQNLGYTGYAHYGYDTLTLGNAGDGGPTIKNTTIGSLATEDFWLGIFGLHPKPTNFSDFGEPSPSHMTALKQQGQIPSLSYGYTAGARYRFTTVLSSLTLGGYDASRFVRNDISYSFAPDNERDLVVWLQKITMTDSTQQNTTFSSQSLNMFIDSAVSQIWLPVEVCQQFEKAFGLIYDEATDLYFVNSTQHDKLKAQNANVTFTIGPAQNGGKSADIVLPYAAFDQVASPPYRGLTSKTNYFPLRRAQNDTQYVLGRTFLQEAYLLVDHERSNFSVYPVNWQANMPPQLLAVAPPGAESTDGNGASSHRPSSGIGQGAIIGIAVGVTAVAIAAAIIAFLLWRRNRKQKEKAEIERVAKLAEEIAAVKDNHSEKSADIAMQQRPTSTAGNEDGTMVFRKAELPANDLPRHELPAGDELKIPEIIMPDSPGTPGTDVVSPFFDPVEADGNERQIFEMEGDMPPRSEADGRMLSEKETMIIREQRYNGTDPDPMASPHTPISRSEGGSTPTTPTEGQKWSRPQLRRVNPADVAMIPGTSTRLSLSPNSATRSDRGWEGPVSPLTPRGPVSLEETIVRSPLSPLTTEGSDGSRTLATLDTNPDRRRFSFEPDP